MSIKSAILKMPMWKFAMLVIIAFLVTVATIEKLLISKAFEFMNRGVDQFEQIFKEDAEDLASMHQPWEAPSLQTEAVQKP